MFDEDQPPSAVARVSACESQMSQLQLAACGMHDMNAHIRADLLAIWLCWTMV